MKPSLSQVPEDRRREAVCSSCGKPAAQVIPPKISIVVGCRQVFPSIIAFKFKLCFETSHLGQQILSLIDMLIC